MDGVGAPTVGAVVTEGVAFVPTEGAGVPEEGVVVATEGAGVPTEGAFVPTEGAGVPEEGAVVATEGAGVPTEGVVVATEGAGITTVDAGVAGSAALGSDSFFDISFESVFPAAAVFFSTDASAGTRTGRSSDFLTGFGSNGTGLSGDIFSAKDSGADGAFSDSVKDASSFFFSSNFSVVFL